MPQASSPIAIVGIGCRFAGADNLQAFWRVTLEGRDQFAPVPPDRWDAAAFYDANPRARDKSYAPTGAWIEDVRSFPTAFNVPPRRLDVTDPQQRLALECAIAAITDAGLTHEAMPHRTGVYMGVTAVEYRTLSSARVVAQLMASGALGRAASPEDAAILAGAVERLVATRPYSAPGLLSNMNAAFIAQELSLHGPAFSTDAACASALVALSSAVMALRTNQIDAALAGGVYLCLTPEHHIAFSRIGAISKGGKCLPFDKRADGFVQGDGCGVVMLKRLADAERDGDRIYALLHGIAMNNDGGGSGPMAPVKEGQIEVIRAAWADAGLSPAGLGYVETHGTGTLVGDHIEFDGLVTALGEELGKAGGRAALGSSKANFGHTMSAAGMAGLLRAVLAIYHEKLPPMANFESPKEDLPLAGSPFFIPTAPTDWHAGASLACVSSFGFGGTNAHVIVGAAAPVAERAQGEPTAAPQAELVCLSASNQALLAASAGEMAEAIQADRTLTLGGIARSLGKRSHEAARAAFVATTREELTTKLAAFARGELPKGVVAGKAADQAPKVAFLFPGQGAQRVGMLAGIRDRFPVVREALATMDEATRGVMAHPVSHYLYPERRGLADAERAAAELTDTENCQPALFAVGWALAQLLRQVGVTPAVTAGHSVGEFTAAAVAGLTSASEGIRWCAKRGQGMQSLAYRAGADGTPDKGAMAALVCDAASAEKYLQPGANIANVNHPRQVVVSGFRDAVAEVARRARAAGVEVTELRVSHGFHSGVFEGLDLAAAVDQIAMHASAVPVASCIAEGSYREPERAREVFKRHARSPVLWTGALERCQAAGATVFLQVAAGGPLLSFVRGTLPGVTALSLASKEDGDGGASLLEGLGALWTLGVPVDVATVTAPGAQASLPPTRYERQSYWVVADQPAEPIQLTTHSGLGLAPKAAPQAAAAVKPVGDAAPATRASEGGDALGDIVYAAIAKASAYPRAALKPTMRLGDDLGFDSMMVADLAEELRKNVAGFVGIPQEILIQGPTIADIVAFVRSPAATAASGATDASMDDLPLGRFAPTWVAAPLPTWGAELPAAGTFVATGDGVEAFAAALVGKGWTRVDGAAGAAATLLVVGTPAGAPVPVSAVLAGEVGTPDYASPLIARLDGAAKAGATPHVVLLRRDDDPWAEAATGVLRSVAREWPHAIVKSLRGGHALTGAELLAELASVDRTTDVRWVGGARSVAGTAALPAIADAQLWHPAANDVVAVTGGTRGIGLALATELARAGAKVIAIGRHAPASLPAGVEVVAADVTDRDGMRRALEGRGVTTLVHAAGLLADGPLGQVDRAVGAAARAVKVDGFVNAVHALGTGLERVLVVGSWAGRFGNRHQAHYAAANALAAELVKHLPTRIQAAASEFGPWAESDMVRSIPPAVQQAMRAEGVDFVGNAAGLRALREDLSARGVVIRGRASVPTTTRRALRRTTLATESHPYLKDHAVQGTPVFPLAAAATTLAEVAALEAPFEVRDLTLFQGVAVTEPVALEATVQGDKAELRQGDKRTLSYRATVGPLGSFESSSNLPPIPPARPGGAPPTTLSLAQFYGGITFHGPLLQGITSIDRIGEDFVVGRVKTSRPGDWMRLTDQPAWAIDPLAFDSAMQLAAYVAYVRYGRAGTPVGFARFVQLAPWPAGEVLAEASFKPGDSDKLDADLVFRTLDGTPIAAAWGVTADMKKVGPTAAAPSPLPLATSTATAPQAAATPAAPVDEPAFVVKPEWVDPSKWRGYKDLAMRLHAVEAMGLKNPYFDLHDGTAKNVTHIAGREIINYSSYNYLGLSGDPRVLDEVEVAVRKYGTSVSASRVASGERPFHRELEAGLAKAHGSDDSLVMPGGHATNVNTIGHLFGVKDLILHDELIHDSCLQGIKLSGAARRSFKHEDMAHLEAQLKELRRHYEKVLLLVEGVYSMDGDVTNLPALIRLKKQYGCMLMVDEAHSFGTVGKTGCGVGELWGLDEPGHELAGSPASGADAAPRRAFANNRRDVDIWMGTMSKSLASMGGWVAGRKELITYLRYTTPGFVFAAGIPPALGQAALSSLNYMLAEPWRVADLQRNSKRFWQLLKERDLDTGPATGDSPVIPVITGDSMWALKLSERLLDQGINAKPIIFPAVANDAARLRFFMTSLHTEAQLVFTADCIAATLAQIRAEAPKKPAPKPKA